MIVASCISVVTEFTSSFQPEYTRFYEVPVTIHVSRDNVTKFPFCGVLRGSTFHTKHKSLQSGFAIFESGEFEPGLAEVHSGTAPLLGWGAEAMQRYEIW